MKDLVDGGVIGISENETSLRRWMVAGSDIPQVLIAYRDKEGKRKNVVTCTMNHEPITITTFMNIHEP